MGIIDWLLKRSVHHKSLVLDHKDHKRKTKDSFRKVKRDNMLIAQRLRQHEGKIRELQNKINKVSEAEPMRVYGKNK